LGTAQLRAEGDKTLLREKRDETSLWNKLRLGGRLKGWGRSLWLKADVIGATEIEKCLSWLKLGLDGGMLNKGHEFTEKLAT